MNILPLALIAGYFLLGNKKNTSLTSAAAPSIKKSIGRQRAIVSINGKHIPNFQMFQLKYLGATNNKPYRVKINDERFHTSVIVSGGKDEVIEYLEKRGYNLVGKAEGKGDIDYIFSDTFISLADKK